MTRSSHAPLVTLMKTIAAAVFFRGIALIVITVLLSPPVICQESSTATDQTEAGGLPFLIEELGAADFARRAAASKQLKQLAVDDIKTLASLSVEHPSAEVIIRLLAEVDARYASDDPETVRAASQALESLSETTRIVLAENANESLRRHWQTRIDLAIKELKENGAAVKNGAFTQNPGIGWGQRSSIGIVNIIIDESWQGGPDALRVFRRLSALVGPIGARGGVSVYLLDGHPLSDRQHAELTEFVGQNRVVERSRVALGITPDSANPGSGVLIRTVSRGSTAASADLAAGDLILGLTATPLKTPKENASGAAHNLRDFDDLVERLKEYRPGDVVYVTVVRDFRRAVLQNRLFRQLNIPLRDNQKLPVETPKPDQEVVEVTLKGWRDLKTDGP
ncbi:MAG TPA: PDZ domain-containing protein [Fuerstia sp.]|nr:PDZ domain-containing protein [Fuerstiella sp.]